MTRPQGKPTGTALKWQETATAGMEMVAIVPEAMRTGSKSQVERLRLDLNQYLRNMAAIAFRLYEGTISTWDPSNLPEEERNKLVFQRKIFHTRGSKTGGKDVMGVRVWTESRVYAWVDFGTKAHWIQRGAAKETHNAAGMTITGRIAVKSGNTTKWYTQEQYAALMNSYELQLHYKKDKVPKTSRMSMFATAGDPGGKVWGTSPVVKQSILSRDFTKNILTYMRKKMQPALHAYMMPRYNRLFGEGAYEKAMLAHARGK